MNSGDNPTIYSSEIQNAKPFLASHFNNLFLEGWCIYRCKGRHKGCITQRIWTTEHQLGQGLESLQCPGPSPTPLWRGPLSWFLTPEMAFAGFWILYILFTRVLSHICHLQWKASCDIMLLGVAFLFHFYCYSILWLQKCIYPLYLDRNC